MSTNLGCIIFALSFVVLCAASGNDYIWGSLDPAADKLMAKEVVSKSGFLGMITTHEYVYQQIVSNIFTNLFVIWVFCKLMK